MIRFYKRSLAALMCAVLCLASIPFAVAPATAVALTGDINSDNIVNLKDALILFRYVSGASSSGAYDYDGNGSVNIADVMKLFWSISGNTDSDDDTPDKTLITVRNGVTDESVYMKNIKVYNEATGRTFTGETKAGLQMAVAEIVRYETGMTTFGENSDEGWKAMAVAAYTVLARHCYNGASYNIYMTKDVDLNNATDKRIYNAVGSVLGIKLAYNDPSKSALNQLCQVFYSASSAGTTCSTLTAWGYTDLEYLQPVESYYDNAEWIAHCSAGIDSLEHSFSITMDDLKACLCRWKGVSTIYSETAAGKYSLYPTKQDGPYWAYSNLYYINSSGAKKYISGIDIYTAINYYHPTVHCYSHALTVTGESNGTIYVTTKGNGHGIGMSQYGMAGYANEAGWTYEQILAHYFCITESTAWGLVGPKW